MIIITRTGLAAGTAEKWKKQYFVDGAWHLHWKNQAPFFEEAYKAMIALGENPDPDAVDKAIGNGSWTRLKCDECGHDKDAVVQLGQEPDYESSTALICPECLNKAHNLVNMEVKK